MVIGRCDRWIQFGTPAAVCAAVVPIVVKLQIFWEEAEDMGEEVFEDVMSYANMHGSLVWWVGFWGASDGKSYQKMSRSFLNIFDRCQQRRDFLHRISKPSTCW